MSYISIVLFSIQRNHLRICSSAMANKFDPSARVRISNTFDRVMIGLCSGQVWVVLSLGSVSQSFRCHATPTYGFCNANQTELNKTQHYHASNIHALVAKRPSIYDLLLHQTTYQPTSLIQQYIITEQANIYNYKALSIQAFYININIYTTTEGHLATKVWFDA